MLYRAAMIGIVAFWLVMMGLLVRLETHPEDTDILDVPVPYVMRLMFRHGQTSFLTVNDQSTQIGTIYLRPATTGSNSRAMNFSGGLTLQLPAQPSQRINYTGAIDMDAALRVRDFHAAFTLRQPPYHLSLKGDSAANSLTYDLRLGSRSVASHTLPMDSHIAAALAQDLGVQAPFPIIPANITPPSITSREADIDLHGEQVEVYQVSIAEAATPVIDFYVTQLGQVVSAKTSFGYSLSPEDWP